MRSWILGWYALFVLLSVACSVPALAQGDEALQGEWVIVSTERGGKAVKGGAEGRMSFIFKGNELTMAPERGPSWTTTYIADTKKTPRTIDILTIDLPLIGIYKVEKDRLMICSGVVKVRPTEFATKPGDYLELTVLERVRHDPPKKK